MKQPARKTDDRELDGDYGHRGRQERGQVHPGPCLEARNKRTQLACQGKKRREGLTTQEEEEEKETVCLESWKGKESDGNILWSSLSFNLCVLFFYSFLPSTHLLLSLLLLSSLSLSLSLSVCVCVCVCVLSVASYYYVGGELKTCGQ